MRFSSRCHLSHSLIAFDNQFKNLQHTAFNTDPKIREREHNRNWVKPAINSSDKPEQKTALRHPRELKLKHSILNSDQAVQDPQGVEYATNNMQFLIN